MSIELNGPGYIRDMLLAIAKNRLILVSEINTPYLFSLETLPKDEPVPDKAVEKLIASLKNYSVLYEENKRRIEGIKKLPIDWKDKLKKKEKKVKVEQEKQARIQQALDSERREQWMKKEVVVNKMVGEICVRLLDIGTRKAFDEVVEVPGAGSFEGVTKIVYESKIRHYCESLKQSQRAAFVKAVAAYENTIPSDSSTSWSPLGSTTALESLIPLLSKKYHDSVLDWILRNTRSYRYYSDAPNIKVWREKQERKGKPPAHEVQRQEEAKIRKAGAATKNLTKAVSRNDLDAICILIKKGADINNDDRNRLLSLAGYARTIGKNEVAELIEESLNKRPKGLFDK